MSRSLTGPAEVPFPKRPPAVCLIAPALAVAWTPYPTLAATVEGAAWNQMGSLEISGIGRGKVLYPRLGAGLSEKAGVQSVVRDPVSEGALPPGVKDALRKAHSLRVATFMRPLQPNLTPSGGPECDPINPHRQPRNLATRLPPPLRLRHRRHGPN